MRHGSASMIAALLVLPCWAAPLAAQSAGRPPEHTAAGSEAPAQARVAAAVVALAAGDFAGARAQLDAARAVGSLDAHGWLVEAVTRLYEGRAGAAAAAYRRALAARPSLAGTRYAVLVGQAIFRATGDAAALAAFPGADAAFYAAAGAAPLFMTRVAADSVALPLTACWPGSPYRCIDLVVGGRVYRVLLDTGNSPGWTVHDSTLAAVLTVVDGGAQRAWTGSAGAVRSHRFLMEKVDFGGFSLRHVPGVFFAKPTLPYFDANLNPFEVRDRVVTLDYGRGLFIVRSKARFDRWLRAQPRAAWTRVPVAGYEWPFVPATVDGRPATALIETGAEALALSRAYAERTGIPLTAVTQLFRGREFRLHRAGLRAAIGTLSLPGDSAQVPASQVVDPLTGFAWDLMVGPGVLDPGFALSFDPFDRVAVLERR